MKSPDTIMKISAQKYKVKQEIEDPVHDKFSHKH